MGRILARIEASAPPGADTSSWRYVPGAGPPWFLEMLLLLNAWYVVCPMPPLRLQLPSLAVFCLSGMLIGTPSARCNKTPAAPKATACTAPAAMT